MFFYMNWGAATLFMVDRVGITLKHWSLTVIGLIEQTTEFANRCYSKMATAPVWLYKATKEERAERKALLVDSDAIYQRERRSAEEFKAYFNTQGGFHNLQKCFNHLSRKKKKNAYRVYASYQALDKEYTESGIYADAINFSHRALLEYFSYGLNGNKEILVVAQDQLKKIINDKNRVIRADLRSYLINLNSMTGWAWIVPPPGSFKECQKNGLGKGNG